MYQTKQKQRFKLRSYILKQLYLKRNYNVTSLLVHKIENYILSMFYKSTKCTMDHFTNSFYVLFIHKPTNGVGCSDRIIKSFLCDLKHVCSHRIFVTMLSLRFECKIPARCARLFRELG